MNHECPKCGCADIRVIKKGKWWGDRCECNHCTHQFNVKQSKPADDAPVADYIPVKCPFCQSRNTRVTSSPGNGVRYHKCLNPNCALPFKSVEK